ncbi:MAG: hypothetical protein Q9227_008313 [Pyrenula ochraceoflavens]
MKLFATIPLAAVFLFACAALSENGTRPICEGEDREFTKDNIMTDDRFDDDCEDWNALSVWSDHVKNINPDNVYKEFDKIICTAEYDEDDIIKDYDGKCAFPKNVQAPVSGTDVKAIMSEILDVCGARNCAMKELPGGGYIKIDVVDNTRVPGKGVCDGVCPMFSNSQPNFNIALNLYFKRFKYSMMEVLSFSKSPQAVVYIVFLCAVIHNLASSYFKAGLNRYPGPLLAKFTKLWHLLDVLSNKHHEHLIQLHKKYGDIVRIGPNELSISRPDYVPRVYGLNPGYLKKSDMYDAFGPRINGRREVSWLSVRNPLDHAAIKKPIAGAYAFSIILEYEPLVDEVISRFLKRLDSEFAAQSGRICDMAFWMRFCMPERCTIAVDADLSIVAYDVITHLTLGESLGFLDKGVDVQGFMQQSDKNLSLTALLSTMPWTAKIFKFNPIVGYFEKTNTLFPVFAQRQIAKRIAKLQHNNSRNDEKNSSKPRARPFLDRFLEAARTDKPPSYDHRLLMEWTLVNIMAGADTTAIALSAILYYLLKSPSKKSKLLKELRAANLSHPVSWKESQKLPYLDACIKEAFRLHPVIGLGLGREASSSSSSSLKMPDGFTLHPGTNVSMNPWVVNRQRSLFGDDVDKFIPERWLRRCSEESEEEYRERLNVWKRSDLFFGGGGSRSCTGKYIALMETYKLIPTILLEFDINLEHPETEWKTINRWTVRQEDMFCTIRSHQGKGERS